MQSVIAKVATIRYFLMTISSTFFWENFYSLITSFGISKVLSFFKDKTLGMSTNVTVFPKYQYFHHFQEIFYLKKVVFNFLYT